MGKNDEFINLNERIIDFVDKFLIDKIGKKNGLEGILTFLFAKSTRTIKAIDRLCLHGLGEDAGILARSLVENLIHIEYIKTGDSDLKCRIFVGYSTIESTKYIEGRGLMDDDRFLSIPEVIKNRNKEIYNTTLAMRQKECERITREKKFHRSNRGWSCLTLKDMAEDTGLRGVYHDRAYWLLSQCSHPNANLIRNYDPVKGKKFTDDFVRLSLQVSINVYLMILKSLNKSFSLGIVEQLQGFYKDYLILMDIKRQ